MAAASSASCLGGRVYSFEPEDLRLALRAGDVSFLANVDPDRLEEASRLGPGGAYYLSRHFSLLGLEDGAARLLEIEWASGFASGGGIAREEAGRALMEAARRSGDWKGALRRAEGFLKRTPGDPEALYQRLEALARLGESEKALSLGAAYPESAFGPGRSPFVRACLAAASPRSPGSASGADVGSFVRDERDPDAILLLSEILDPESSVPSLLRARRYVAQREYALALADFARFPDIFSGPPGQAIVSDAGKAWLFGGKAAEGAGLFASLAGLLGDGNAGEKALAHLYAARCLIANGQKSQARSHLESSFRISAKGPEKDAAAWFLIDSAKGLGEAVDSAAATAGSWNDPGYFSDLVDELVRECVRLGEFGKLETLEKGLSGYAGALADRRIRYILDRARATGRLPPSNEGRSAPPALSGSDAYSYFPIMESYLLSGPDPAVEGAGGPAASARPRMEKITEEEAFVRGFIDYGLYAEASQAAFKYADKLRADFLRSCAKSLLESGHPAESARMISYLARTPGYAPEREDLETAYPRIWEAQIKAAAEEFGLPKRLLAALVRTESYFDPAVVSRAGAVGLTQLMPETADAAAKRLKISQPDLADPETNLRIGAFYLADLIRYFKGDVMKGLLSYNGGMGRVRAWAKENPSLPADLFLETVPIDETREYVRKVLAALAVYGYLYDGLPMGDAASRIYPGLGGK